MRTPFILSLIYDGGTILASKRSPYTDLLDDGSFTEQVLGERLQRQHKLICAAIQAGRIEDLKRMSMKESAAQKESSDKAPEPPPVPEHEAETIVFPENQTIPLPQIIQNEPIINEMPALLVFKERTVLVERQADLEDDPEIAPIPKPTDGLIFEVPKILAEPVIEEVKIIEEETILPDEAVVILSENANQPPPPSDKLTVSLLNEITLKGGERKTINILVGRGESEIGLTKAHVVIKILGSTFRPLIFHAKTDSNGIAVVHLQLPHFKAGRAVLFIRAMYDGEETEIRRVISQG
ncbi:MAG: hypothetical protein R2747_07675 [Pyrinomonadaceae bacterium]